MSSDDDLSDSGMDSFADRDGGGGKDSDDEFNFGEYESRDAADGRAAAKATVVQNLPHDEEVDLGSSDSLDESVDTEAGGGSPGGPPRSRSPAGGPRGDSPPAATEESHGHGEYDDHVEIPGQRTQAPAPIPAPAPAPAPNMGTAAGGGSESESSSEEEEEEESTVDHAGKAGGYNPADYAHLDVSSEIRELFGYIGRYKPHNIELETKLKCFIPDYIPAVGEIDAFIKVARPDGKEDDLGLKVLDEPAAHQSDPTVLELQWRGNSKKSGLDPVRVTSIEHADKNPKEIMKWIASIQELHRTKPPPQVHYTKSMPDIEQLMQVWPDEFEELLKTVKLPSADMNMSVKEYANVICSIMDIPVYGSVVQSLHVLFTLYSEFKSNQHFMNMQGGAAGGAGAGAGAGPGATASSGGAPGGAPQSDVYTFG